MKSLFEPQLSRRRFIQGALATGAVLTTTRPRLTNALNFQRRYAPVKVAHNRVIREVVGLRPYRPGGFVVSAERLGPKLLIHNYGHGGGGVTLSWGTATLAAELVQTGLTPLPRTRRQTNRRFAVLGCGVSGLSTAILLQRRFQNGPGTVTIYAKDLPPNTTSNVAGASWSPTSVFQDGDEDSAFNKQFRRACLLSNKAFQLLVGNNYGVRWIETLELLRSEFPLQDELPGGNSLYPELTIQRNPDRFFGFPYTRQYNTMLIEPNIYLPALMRDFHNAGGRIVVKEFRDREELRLLSESVIVNCTGLGSRALFDDQELIPVRGQLEVLLPQPEVDYCYLSSGYMFPRRDGIILGGTWDHDDWSLTPNPEQANRILQGHAEIMKGLKQ
jgi:D-amino-acid oxidase